MIISKQKITEDVLLRYLANSDYDILSGSGYELLDFGLKTNLKIRDLYTKEKFDSCHFTHYRDYYSDEPLYLLLAWKHYGDLCEDFDEENIFFTEEYPLDNLFDNCTALTFSEMETPNELCEEDIDKKISLNLQEEQNKLKEFLLRNLKEYFTTTDDDAFGTMVKYKIRLEELCENEFNGDFLEEQDCSDWEDFWENIEVVWLDSRNLPSESMLKGIGFSENELEEFVNLCSKLDIKVKLRYEEERDLN